MCGSWSLKQLKETLETVPPRKMIANCSHHDAAFLIVGCKQIEEKHPAHEEVQIEFPHSSIQAQNCFLKQSPIVFETT